MLRKFKKLINILLRNRAYRKRNSTEKSLRDAERYFHNGIGERVC